MASAKTIQFVDFELNAEACDLRKRGIRIKLQEQPLSVLTILVEHAGHIVTKEELRQRLWASDTFVDFDHGLHSAVTRLREALGDSSERSRFIETVPRRGYRFVAPVTMIHSDASPGLAVEPDPSIPAPRGRRFALGIWAMLGVVLFLLILLISLSRWVPTLFAMGNRSRSPIFGRTASAEPFR